MDAMTLSSELPIVQSDSAADSAGDGRPMLGITLGLLLSMPLWAGIFYASAWI